MNRLLRALGIASLLTLSLASTASAHHIVDIDVQCENKAIVIEGADFDVEENSPVEVTGPDEYFETFVVPSSDWTHAFPLGSNGSYTVDWPGAGNNAKTFVVDCEEPVEECPEGQVGTPPDCEEPPDEECPEGQAGTPPDCTTPPESVATSFDCGEFTVIDGREGWSILVVTHNFTGPDQTFGPFDGGGNETFDIAADVYDYVFLDGGGETTDFRGSFTVQDCPTPAQFSARVAPCPDRTSNISGIRFIGLLLLLHVRIDGIEVTPDENGDVAVVPGVHAWSISNAEDTEVLASGELLCPTCNAAEPTPKPTPPPTDTEVTDNTGVFIASAALAFMVCFIISIIATSYLIRRR